MIGIIPFLVALAADPLADHFRPPADLADDFGSYRTPLKFDDGRPVQTPEEWQERRREILDYWHTTMGPWPVLLPKPTIEELSFTKKDQYTRNHVRIDVAPDRRTDDAYLLVPDGEGPFPAVLVVYYDGKTGIGEDKPLRDFALQLTKRGFVTLSIGSPPASFYPDKKTCRLQPLSYHAYVAANCHTILAQHPKVDPKRIGIVGHSYGGKWAMFAACLYDKFAAAAVSDPGIVFDEKRGNVNYWDEWYLGFEPGLDRPRGVMPRTGPYKKLIAEGRDLHELHALMAPRPFLVSGGAEDKPERWKALNHTIAVNKLLGHTDRVGMTNRDGHSPTEESNEQLYSFFEKWLNK